MKRGISTVVLAMVTLGTWVSLAAGTTANAPKANATSYGRFMHQPAAILSGWHLWRFPPLYSGPINA